MHTSRMHHKTHTQLGDINNSYLNVRGTLFSVKDWPNFLDINKVCFVDYERILDNVVKILSEESGTFEV